MSITTFGVDGYDYQYLASLYIILRFQQDWSNPGAFIEKLNSEDLTFHTKSGEKIEVQFKKRNEMFGVEDLSTCLAKFDPHSSSINILSKLIDKQTGQFYIVTDAIAENIVHDLGLLAKPLSLSKYSSRSSNKQFAVLSDSLKVVYSKRKSKLDESRDIFMQATIPRLAKKINREVLTERIAVVDRLDNLTLSSHLSSILNDKNIPFSKHHMLVGDLIEIIKTNRSNNVDILPLMLSSIDYFAVSLPQVLENYLLTGKEKILQRKLFSERILLLTGASLCGKTQTALYVSRKFLENRKGAAYLATSSTNEAENFLFANVSEDRLVFIEDPFGQHFNDQCAAIDNRLKIIIQHIASRPNRFLVVTSNINIINRLQSSPQSIPWINLSISDPNILVSYWKTISGISDDNLDFFSKTLFEVLRDDPADQLLQFGQLDYILANKHKIASINAETIRHMGNFKVSDIYDEILHLDSSLSDFLLRFAICCNGTWGVGIDDIQFLLDVTPEYLPGINKKDNDLGTLLIGRGNKDEQKLAVYRPFDPLSTEIERTLQDLIDQGYLQYSASIIRFRHPIYEEASKRLLNGKDNLFRYSMILKIVAKGMGTLNERLALNIIKNMSICIDYIIDDNTSSVKLLQAISIGLKSTFVNVRDHCQIFLVAHYGKLPESLMSKVESLARNRGYNSNDYYWHGDVPYIPADPHPSMSSGYLDRMMMRSAGAKMGKRIFRSDVYLNPKDADLALENLVSMTKIQAKRISYPILSLLPFLRYNEIFIRERAAYLIAASLNDKNFTTYRYLLLDENVFVKFQILRGLFRSWPYFDSQTIKDKVFELLKGFLMDYFVALSSIDLFTQFGIGHGSASFQWESEIEATAIPAMWSLWASLMPAFTSSLPKDIHAHTPRLYSTLLEAKVSEEEKRVVILSWLEWLLRHLKSKNLWLKEIVSTVIDILNVNFELFDTQVRCQYLERLSKINHGLFQSFLLRLMLRHWNTLSKEERSIVMNILKLKKELIPISATAAMFPEELQTNLGISISKNKKAYSEIDVEGNQILMQCLTQLYIYPPTADLSWATYLGWNECLVDAISNPLLPAFRIAFSVYVEYKTGYERFGKIKWPKNDLIKKAIMSKPELATFLFDVLLEDLLQNNGSNLGPLWTQFFNALGDSQKEEFSQKILNVAEAASQWKDNLLCIPNQIFNEYLLPHLKADNLVYYLLKANEFAGNEEGTSVILTTFLQKAELRLSNSILNVRNWFEKHWGRSSESYLLADQYLTTYFDKASSQASLHRKKVEKYFSKWYPDWAPEFNGNDS